MDSRFKLGLIGLLVSSAVSAQTFSDLFPSESRKKGKKTTVRKSD